MTPDHIALARNIRTALFPRLPQPLIPYTATPTGDRAIRWRLLPAGTTPGDINGRLNLVTKTVLFECLARDGSDWPESSYDAIRAVVNAGIPAWSGLIDHPELTLSDPLEDAFEAWRWIETTLTILMEVT